MVQPPAWRLALYNWIFIGLIEQPNPAIAGAEIPCDLGNVQPFALSSCTFLIAFFARRVPLLSFDLVSLGTDVFARRRRHYTLNSGEVAGRRQ